MRSTLPISYLVGCWLVAFVTGEVQDSTFPDRGILVASAEHAQKFILVGQTDRAEVEMEKRPDEPVDVFHRITVSEAGRNSWDTQLQIKGLEGITKGDVLLARFKLRGEESSLETGEVRVGLTIEEEETYHKIFLREFTAGKDWVQYEIPIVAEKSISPVQLSFTVGSLQQTVHIADVELWSYPRNTPVELLPRTKFTYKGREPGAKWREEAFERIARYRMGELNVEVRDKDGVPAEELDVQVRMMRHAFFWGTDVGDAVFLEEGPRGVRYRDLLIQNFNYAVPGQLLKWGSWETNQTRALETLSKLQEMGMGLKAHCIIWPGFRRWATAQGWDVTPKRIFEMRDDPVELRRTCEERVTQQVSTLQPYGIESYDVVNEPYEHHDIMDVLGEEVMFDWFRMARKLDPQATLVLNEATTLDRNPKVQNLIRLSRRFQEHQVPLDALGIQAHYGVTLTPPEQAFQVLEHIAETGRKIQITEFDMPGEDQQLHADYVRDFITVVFSHPAVTHFVMWGFTDAVHWRSKDQAGLWDADFKIKPAGEAYRTLVFDRFWTKLEGKTNTAGQFIGMGFYGTYEVVIRSGNREARKTVDLIPGGTHVQITW